MSCLHRLEAPVDTSCSCCWDDIDASNYVEYKSSPDSEWFPSGFCVNCIQHLIDAQWDTYVNGLAKTTCKAEQRRLLQRGPPINVRDPKALACPEDGEVHLLWFMNDGLEHSAKLTGSLEGEVCIIREEDYGLCIFIFI